MDARARVRRFPIAPSAGTMVFSGDLRNRILAESRIPDVSLANRASPRDGRQVGVAESTRRPRWPNDDEKVSIVSSRLSEAPETTVTCSLDAADDLCVREVIAVRTWKLSSAKRRVAPPPP